MLSESLIDQIRPDRCVGADRTGLCGRKWQQISPAGGQRPAESYALRLES